MTIARDGDLDRDEVERRLALVAGLDMPSFRPDRSTVVVLGEQVVRDSEADAFLMAVREPSDDIWYIRHMEGPTTFWWPAIRQLGVELRARGEGSKPVRWKLPVRPPQLQRRIFRLMPWREVVVERFGRTTTYGEFTPNEEGRIE